MLGCSTTLLTCAQHYGCTTLADHPVCKSVTYLGCFKDFDNGVRVLQNRVTDLTAAAANKAEECAASCRAAGFHYAGLQFGFQCWCGNSYDTQGRATNCDMQCI
eukprot:8680-Heterococcus_DN1.PRE.1